ncbi:phosphoribosyltransferase [Citrobacter amalonaticus]|uniref:phosphoribosyltransferase n=1 Tax=Citrobacter amalonaticus TaxID=35703 RepID=UPI0007337468|nr:phosphoribosyltransferase [Citrobacter amalonaticus]PNP33010.1 hypothetical protein AL525_003570 [Citrobacter amalonaticus]
MGINISNKKVITFCDSHEKYVNTSVNSNPSLSLLKQCSPPLLVHSIFKRVQSNDRRDGNPLIYALKNIDNYSISNEELIKFKPNFVSVLDKLKNNKKFKGDVILTLPSSSKVVQYFAKRVGRTLSLNVQYDAFVKCTNGEVFDNFNHNIVRKQDENDVRGALYTLNKKNPDLPFQIKNIENSIRSYFQPFKLNQNNNYNQYNIILIDDILSTGSSLLCAEQLLKNKCQSIMALTLLGSLR